MRPQPVRIAIDLETTGLNPEQDAVIEIGALKFAGNETLETFESFVKPGIALPYRIQRLTGISASQLQNAPTMQELLPRLRTFLGDAPLVGHSVQFDVAFLRRYGLAQRNPLVDTYELASTLLPSLSSYTLGSVGVALGVASPTFHLALADAQLARDVFLALLRMLEELDPSTLDVLSRLPAPPDWTPGYFIRQASRARGASAGGAFGALGGGTLGEQLAAKLGVDPTVLSLAIAPQTGQARPRQRTVTAATLPLPAISPEITQAAAAAEAELSQTLVTHVRASFRAGGAALVEVQNDDGGIVACLAEALRWAREQQGRVLVSVASSEAASHITQHLMPRVTATLGLAADEARVAELGERQDYLCLHRWFGTARLPRDGVLQRDVARGLAKLAVWVSQTRTGVRSEVALGGQEMEAWTLVRAGTEFADSLPSCAYRRDGYCFVVRAQRVAQEAELVVTTHAALAKHLAGHDELLPPCERVLVLDGHLLEDELRQARSRTLDRQELLAHLATLAVVETHGRHVGLLHLAADLLGTAGRQREQVWFAQVERVRHSVDQFFATARRLLGESQGQGEAETAAPVDAPEQRVLRLDGTVREQQAWPELVRGWNTLAERLAALAKSAREAARLVAEVRGEQARTHASEGIVGDLLGSAYLLEQAQCDGAAILTDETSNGESVTWLRVPYASPTVNQALGGQRQQGRRHRHGERDGRSARHETRQGRAPRDGAAREQGATGQPQVEAPLLHRAPVRVGALLEPLYAPGKGLIVTAPALAVAGDFTYTRVGLGLPDTTQTLGPAMSRAEQTLLCLPTDVPEPNAPQYQRRLDEAIIRLASALKGRLVVILPSHAALRAVAGGIRRALEQRDILVLAQGLDGSARQLWQTFRTEPQVVLLGAGTFWEGAEQAEQPPACVVVTRVPFPALSDPLNAARAEMWSDPQSQFVVPHAALRLRQALGGLAWSHWQRNAVVLFDRRLQTRGYGATILGTLPKCTQYQDTVDQIVERVGEWVGPSA